MFLALPFLGCVCALDAKDIYVSPRGSDTQGEGTRARPLKTLSAALNKSRLFPSSGQSKTVIFLDPGTYYLTEPLILTNKDSGLTLRGDLKSPERVVISGATLLPSLKWSPFRDGIFVANIPAGTQGDSLFLNGEMLRIARFPNANPSKEGFDGHLPKAVLDARLARWKKPEGAFLHALHGSEWGGVHFKVDRKNDNNSLAFSGTHQTNRPERGAHQTKRFIENVFEELDEPGEWFLDREGGKLYCIPPDGIVLSRAKVELSTLENLVTVDGAKKVKIEGITFTQTLRTFMKTIEPLTLSDWCIYRGGALLFKKASNCSVEDCNFWDLGGNAFFVDGQNENIFVRRSHFTRLGASATAFVGSASSARGAKTYKEKKQLPWAKIDKTPGPANNDFPKKCGVSDCLIENIGLVEKQSAGVQIELAQGIVVENCSIYDVPRAGINVGSGCFGEHRISGCDVFNTVLETNDHGAFNSWGRDRWWAADGRATVNLNDDKIFKREKDLIFLDCGVSPTIIETSRFQCDHGWDIDLDDGSSNYIIRRNILLSGGLKLREGFFRTAEENLILNNSVHTHVWFKNSNDIVAGNWIQQDCYFPAGGMPQKPWGKKMDKNLVFDSTVKTPVPARGLQIMSGGDKDSQRGEFVTRDKRGSFICKSRDGKTTVVFSDNDFGVREKRLRQIAKTPEIKFFETSTEKTVPGKGKSVRLAEYGFSATVRDIRGLGDRSAYGLEDNTGVLVLSVDAGGRFLRSKIQAEDVIVAVNGEKVSNVNELSKALGDGTNKEIEIFRKQQRQRLRLR